jgi:hypothetical protein
MRRDLVWLRTALQNPERFDITDRVDVVDAGDILPTLMPLALRPAFESIFPRGSHGVHGWFARLVGALVILRPVRKPGFLGPP